MRDDGIDFQANKFGRQKWQAVESPLRPAILDDEILTFLVSAIPKTLSKRRGLTGEIRGGSLAEKAEPVDPVAGLRPGGERRGEEAASDVARNVRRSIITYWGGSVTGPGRLSRRGQPREGGGSFPLGGRPLGSGTWKADLSVTAG